MVFDDCKTAFLRPDYYTVRRCDRRAAESIAFTLDFGLAVQRNRAIGLTIVGPKRGSRTLENLPCRRKLQSLARRSRSGIGQRIPAADGVRPRHLDAIAHQRRINRIAFAFRGLDAF